MCSRGFVAVPVSSCAPTGLIISYLKTAQNVRRTEGATHHTHAPAQALLVSIGESRKVTRVPAARAALRCQVAISRNRRRTSHNGIGSADHYEGRVGRQGLPEGLPDGAAAAWRPVDTCLTAFQRMPHPPARVPMTGVASFYSCPEAKVLVFKA